MPPTSRRVPPWRSGLLTRELNGEFVVVDEASGQAHQLVGDLAEVWRAARDGAEVEPRLSSAVAELVAVGLLAPAAGMTRRTALQRGGALVAVTGLTTIALPAAANAISGAVSKGVAGTYTLTIPASASATSVNFTLIGGGGAAGEILALFAVGGNASAITGTFTRASSAVATTFTVAVGGGGKAAGPGGTSPFSTGGAGGAASEKGGGGGGASAIYTAKTAGNVLVVASGGGGAGGSATPGVGAPGATGNVGNAGAAGTADNNSGGLGGATVLGGTRLLDTATPGAGGTAAGGISGSAGTIGIGGTGGAGATDIGSSGGGGSGGWAPGGGGAAKNSKGGGGGGSGSNFTAGTFLVTPSLVTQTDVANNTASGGLGGAAPGNASAAGNGQDGFVSFSSSAAITLA